MIPTRTKVIACATVVEEMLPLMPPGMAYQVLDFGLHVNPDSLKRALQDAVDGSVPEAETIIPGLRKSTQVMLALTPKDFGQLVHLNDHHSFGGYCPMMGKSGAPHRTPFKGLWFLGGQSESGPGVWTQIISSRSVFQKARREL